MLLKNTLLAAFGLISYHMGAQEAVRFVDFHSHPAMKNYYRNVPSYQNMNDAEFIKTIQGLNWGIPERNQRITNTVKFSGVNGKKSYDQATYDLLDKGNASIICASIYALEKQSTSPLRLPYFRITMRTLNRAFASKISDDRQKAAYECTGYDEYKSQIKFLETQYQSNSRYPKKIKIADIANDLNDSTFIPLVITVEGVHNFYGTQNDILDSVNSYQCNDACINETLKNLKEAKNNHRIFFITPSHLFWGKVAGHARGLDIDIPIARRILARLMWSQRFAMVDGKDGDGIIGDIMDMADTTNGCECAYDNPEPIHQATYGRAFLTAMLDTDNKYKARTLIDMRHMDVKARAEVIEFAKEYGEKHETNIPLIVSHAAVNGKTQKRAMYLGLCPRNDDYKEMINPARFYNYLLKMGCGANIDASNPDDITKFINNSGWFHPMSNNLYDEEIASVYKSKGIIGITMEERALGKNSYNYRHHKKALNKFAHKYGKTNHLKLNRKLYKDLNAAEPFVRNLFYIVEHSGAAGIERWKHVGLGTDFDGIMNPIDICPTSAHIPKFFAFLVTHLDMYADYLGKKNLLGDVSNDELLRMVFYKNGEKFIRDNF